MNSDPDKQPPTKHVEAFRWAFAGIAYCLYTQRNMRIHLVFTALALIIGFLLRLALLEWALIVICVVLVLASEMLNTAIETTVDLAMPNQHAKAKTAKDVAAGVVLLFALMSVVAGILVYIHAFLRLIGGE